MFYPCKSFLFGIRYSLPVVANTGGRVRMPLEYAKNVHLVEASNHSLSSTAGSIQEQSEVGALYWTVPAPEIVNPGR